MISSFSAVTSTPKLHLSNSHITLQKEDKKHATLNRTFEAIMEEAKDHRRYAESFDGSFCVPDSPDAWRKLAKQGRIFMKSIHDIRNMLSGSKVRKRQFAAMKAIWPQIQDPAVFENRLDQFGLEAVWEQASSSIWPYPLSWTISKSMISLKNKSDGLVYGCPPSGG
ncbi:hypothetical protein ASPSYDRAFT_48058 [Aspergillus sydowii CBS 593.65]|uniref:Uncharacterized protein n=1 Tax=Aspergillus sydowii CBS 593.65 TaxID=1036612 RepID=A0A1L9T8S5_9EURO|nr:uncharacterized protein ASPSYDRAFT_48058 [Aspergillus sydowii CBS 593.65]OJJ55816.1 hypothetical protein ASPSYDRAFT_48058 [Aspergillus sydowii CBS 593.65]